MTDVYRGAGFSPWTIRALKTNPLPGVTTLQELAREILNLGDDTRPLLKRKGYGRRVVAELVEWAAMGQK